MTANASLRNPMPTRPLGNLGWQASVLTLGGVKWDFKCTPEEAVALIRRAYELGVNTFDTALVYSNGESERRLGVALEGIRDQVWINTKTSRRPGAHARQDLEGSLLRLRTDRVDLMFIHALDDEQDLARVLAPDGCLAELRKAKEEGLIRFLGVSGHWHKQSMLKLLEREPLDAILIPVGIFNEAYGYSYFRDVVPLARSKGMAILGMKVYGAGRIQHVADLEPYLRFSLGQDLDSAVIGMESIAQLEQTVSLLKRQPPLEPLPPQETEALFAEARRVTQQFDAGEFNWVSHYRR
jgi:aryl-alcohol dehydrogenase-like predicted oxidoreductase